MICFIKKTIEKARKLIVKHEGSDIFLRALLTSDKIERNSAFFSFVLDCLKVSCIS